MNMLLFFMVIAVGLVASVVAEPTVELGSAADYVILAKTGISTVPDSVITGDIAVSPITGAAMTGFAFTKDLSGEFSRAGQISGNAYAADFAAPTPSQLTSAIQAMQVAYTDAAGRPNSNAARLNLGGGLLGGAQPGGPEDQLTPGVYTFSTGITIGGDLHFDGMCSVACILLLFHTNIPTPLTHKNTWFPFPLSPQVLASTSSRWRVPLLWRGALE
jgi:hypothetical protein